MAYRQEGKIDEPEQALQRSLALHPLNGLTYNLLEKLKATQQKPEFSPLGTYALDMDLPLEGVRKRVKMMLRITRSTNRYQGQVAMTPSLLSGMLVKEVVLGGQKLWITVDIPNGFPLELRLKIEGGKITGTWVAGYENNGRVWGRKEE